MPAQDDEFHENPGFLLLPQRADQGQPVHPRHLHIQEHNIRPFPLHHRQRLLAVARQPHYLDTMLFPGNIVGKGIAQP
ncbi:hypothetical protein D3C81_1894680 [compost metagenome]